ncbi:hypothetical protein K1T71_005201 [Dendrolimus kikuchii]|uniref:Uncharacterized protein n=1 Tax=Dendrolimus kikuchii TaxID=765133 RepID=A0ACC1D6G0_9NEOP|nr:hypothetical protein K1T71_005201 [Dendrolimus kikuchii]
MPVLEAPCVELGSAPCTPSIAASPSPSEISSASSPEPQIIRATPLFRALAMSPPEPEQPPGQDELERRLPGYRRIVIPRELTLIELLKQSSGVTTDEEVLQIRETKLRVIAERVGLRRLHVLAPRLRNLTLDGSALSSLRDLGIGLIHLKILSINRCGLYTLDGVWGLGALRELYAAGNRIQDLHALGALQKLHTLDLANNPIAESSLLWTLGVCGSLRRLTLQGTPLSDSPHYYRSRVASALPMLVYLDELPLHTDVDYNLEEDFGPASSSSDSENEEPAPSILPKATQTTKNDSQPIEFEPKPSTSKNEFDGINKVNSDRCNLETQEEKLLPIRCRRPATTENAGIRPNRPAIRQRPKTAVEKPNINAPTRLQILNTLMDEEWRCSGSNLTSHGAVCGNLARALRRPKATNNKDWEVEREMVEQTMEEASRALAAEIPRAPRLEDWARFKQETGIEIDIDFNERPKEADPTKAIERLEQIEKDTMDRFKQGDNDFPIRNRSLPLNPTTFATSISIMTDFDAWKMNTEYSDSGDLMSLNDMRDLNLEANARSVSSDVISGE